MQILLISSIYGHDRAKSLAAASQYAQLLDSTVSMRLSRVMSYVLNKQFPGGLDLSSNGSCG